MLPAMNRLISASIAHAGVARGSDLVALLTHQTNTMHMQRIRLGG